MMMAPYNLKEVYISMSTLIKYNLKIIWMSPIYWVANGFITAFFLLFIFLIYPQSINFSVTLHGITYIEIIIMIFVFCSSVYFSRISYSIEQLVQIPNYMCIIARLLATGILFWGLLLLPLCFIIFASLIERVEFVFVLEVLLDVHLRWFGMIFFFSSLGFLFGSICKWNIIYLASIPSIIMFSHLNSIVIEKFLSRYSKPFSILTSILSVQAPFQNAVQLEYMSSLLDRFFFSKEVIIFAGSAIIICCTLLLTSHKKPSGKLILLLGLSIAATATSCSIYIKLFPHSYSYEEKIYPTQKLASPFSITAYEGDISLSEKFSAHCQIQVKRNMSSSSNELILRLDESLIVDSMLIDGEEIQFNRDGDYLTVDAKMLPSTPLFEMELGYHGRIYYISDISGRNILSLRKTAALPSSFAFVPVVDGDSIEKEYFLTVKGKNTVISNINPVKTGNNTYIIEGSSDTLCLFMGYFTSFKINETTVYRTKYNKVTDYKDVFSNAFKYSYFDPYIGEQSTLSLANKPTAFLIYDLYGVLGYPVQYKDYWIINYGFPM